MDNMALPKGLLIRANGYYFQARISKQYLSHYPKATLYEKLLTDNRKDAIRLVHARWAKLHEEFERIDSTGNKSKTSITLEVMQAIVDTMVHSKIAEDGAMRSRGYHADPTYKARALSKLSSDEQAVKDAISQGNYKDIEDSAQRWLRGHGYSLDIGSSEYRAFLELFSEGLAKVNKAIREREIGNVVTEPVLPPVILSQSTNNLEETDWDSLDKLREYWLLQPAKSSGGKKSRTAEAEATTIIKKFRAMVGDLKPSEVTRSHVADLKDKMLEAGSSPATINKGRGILAAIFSNAVINGKLDKNPFYGMEKLVIPQKEVESPYTIEELQTIFSSPVFTKGFRPKNLEGDAIYWMPLLSLYSGARLNELGQIYIEDISNEDGIDFYMIKPDVKTGRTVKDGKRRRVPIHPDLIKMGFLGYVANIKSTGNLQLFPELMITSKDRKIADNWADGWSSYVRKDLGITKIPQPFHAFRHSFVEHGRRSRIDAEHRRLIEGHAVTTVEMKAYGHSLYPLEPLYDELKKLTYKGLDLSHLYITSNELP